MGKLKNRPSLEADIILLKKQSKRLRLIAGTGRGVQLGRNSFLIEISTGNKAKTRNNTLVTIQENSNKS